ncbi:M57 family metalloprotease [Dokdonia pacifica]|uniref:Dual-action HEIGH metallo-peptidase n=1 Tax=Dokdonia pacifica TaxID=1627892 RepID=A0A239ASY9_9FLAO|nr:M57 family metalloprotease [Dokdonia pacifica]SNR98670.1 Dual-action HEIGH metallo-peptidase [Dokdonia pacifica]
MKTNLKSVFLLMAGTMLLFSSCERDEVTIEDDANLVTEVSAADIVNSDVTTREPVTDQKVLDLINNLDIDAGAVTKGDFHLPDGTIEQRIYIGDDIVVTEAELNAMQAIDAQSRQYRTFNLVTGNNRTIDILGYTGNDQFGLSNRGQTALQWAVNNYNRLSGVTLQFNLTYGTNFNAADMVVYDNSTNNSGSGGVAGFPTSAGRPHKFIQIYNLDGFSTNVNEHVITHEIGHAVGFRHSDWFDRLSCPTSSQGNEGSGSDGAVHVAGTPTGRDVTSVMQACFSSSEDGEFNNNDITALRNMY